MTNPTQTLGGVLFCVFGLLAFAIQDAMVKDLTQTYPVMEILTLRTAAVLAGLLVIILGWKGKALLKTTNPAPLLWRGALAFSAFTSYYLAVSVIPLADAATVYMTAPLFVTALSVPLLGERFGWHRWASVLVGFAAVVVMINPGSGVFQIAAALPLVSAVLYSFIPIINRHVGLSEHALTMALYAIMSYAILCVIAGILIHTIDFDTTNAGIFANLARRWVKPDVADAALIVASGMCFIVGLLGLTQAYRLLPVSIVAPFEYSYIVWATLLGFIVFSEVPSLRTVCGAVVIVSCGCYIIYRERQSKTT